MADASDACRIGARVSNGEANCILYVEGIIVIKSKSFKFIVN